MDELSMLCMETKFNFNSQICTSREQSERLLALGLKKETADCMHTYCWAPEDGIVDEIPAWSLHRLMCFVFNNGGTHVDIFEDDDAYEVLIYNIEMRIKEGYFNKEYLG